MVSSSSLSASAVDRLTSLPDDILYSIMSFLPAQQAVQTCVLSHRWEDLWRSLPCLNIDQREFNTAASGATASSRFEEFVNNLLMLHKAPSLDMFRFHASQDYEFEVVTRWFRRGLKCCPSVVDLEIYTSANARFHGLPNLGSSACHITKLHLVEIWLERGFTQDLPSGCPVLEDLKLDRCVNLHPPEITSYTLKNLIVTDCTTCNDNVLTITAPNLVSFHLGITSFRRAWGGIFVNEMLSLAEATICLKQGNRSKSVSPRARGLCKLLCSLTNMRNLKLSGSETLSILNEEIDTSPIFPNLRTLLVDECDLSGNFQMLGCFLNSAPSLEKLVLQYCKVAESCKKRKTRDNLNIKCQDTLSSQCTNLKVTKIKYKEEDIRQLLELLAGLCRNIGNSNILLCKD